MSLILVFGNDDNVIEVFYVVKCVCMGKNWLLVVN